MPVNCQAVISKDRLWVLSQAHAIVALPETKSRLVAAVAVGLQIMSGTNHTGLTERSPCKVNVTDRTVQLIRHICQGA
jgi:hypothetical protein